jgi:putative addiction module component (TIGR02574 family)
MSKTEILDELPKLTPDERHEILSRILALDPTEWLDNGELTEEEKAVIIKRLDDIEKNPNAFIPWEEVEARLKRRLAKVRRKK